MTSFPSEPTVTRWEALAHAAREEMAGARVHGVGASHTPAVEAALDSLTATLAEVVGEAAADWAVTQWVITEQPVADLAWFHHLVPGTRVAIGERVGVVEAADPDGMVESLGPLMQRWVLWDGQDEPVLVRTVDLSVAAGQE